MGKTSYKLTGPWLINKKLNGGSYEIKNIKSNKIDKKHASQLSPIPNNLKSYPPLSGADTSYQQIHQRYVRDSLLETSVEGTALASLALAEPVTSPGFSPFPTISEFNAEIQRETYLLRQSVQVHLRTDHPNVNTTQICLPSSLINLKKDDIMPSIILSTDKLFFVRSKTNDTYEWILVQLNLNLSIQKDPSCVKNHRFLFDHYHCHPKDIKYPHTNRRYWKEYHKILGKSQIHDKIHLIKPT